MPYEPPSGWVEPLVTDDEPEDGRERLRFHLTDRCPLIRDRAQLRAVDKPYTATRCVRCAGDA